MALLIGFSFAQKPTQRTPASTDYVKLLDSNTAEWDQTLDQIFSASLDPTFDDITADDVTVDQLVADSIDADYLGMAVTSTANSYNGMISTEWTAGADMTSGGSNGIYAIANPVEDVQNAYGLRARMDLRDAAADVAVNQLHAIDALINLNDTATIDYTVDDNVSVVGAAIHGGVTNALMTGTGVGGLGGATLNLYQGMWGPTAEQDYALETNFIKMISHAGTTVDYGLNIESSSDMDAGILLNNHASNSDATMDVGVEMISAAGKMVYGIDMSQAGITTAEIRGQNSETLDNVTDGSWRATSDLIIGAASPNEVMPTFSIVGDADSDADDVSETLALTLTPNATPTSATWDFTSTQSAGYTFDKPVAITGVSTGLDMQGAYTNAAIDLTDVTLNHSGSSGPVMIRAGTYGSPVSSSDPHQSGMIRLYGSNDAATDDGTGFYDRGLFAYLRTDKAKGIFPVAGLAEVRTTAGDGPVAVMASQFIAGLHTADSKLAATASVTDGMFGSWLKVYSVTGSVAAATSRVAPVWLDNQMSGTVSGEEYAAFITSGGSKVDAVFGFETSSVGWTNLMYFDETAYDQDPVVAGDATGGSKDYGLRVSINGTAYLIQLYAE